MVKTVSDLVEGAGRAVRAPARFTEQLVALVVPDRRDRVMALKAAHGISQAAVMRAVIDLGLPALEKKLAEGKLDPATLA
jgi:hypothetical protein